MVRELPSPVRLHVPLPEGVSWYRNVVDARGATWSIMSARRALNERQPQVRNHGEDVAGQFLFATTRMTHLTVEVSAKVCGGEL